MLPFLYRNGSLKGVIERVTTHDSLKKGVTNKKLGEGVARNLRRRLHFRLGRGRGGEEALKHQQATLRGTFNSNLKGGERETRKRGDIKARARELCHSS